MKSRSRFSLLWLAAVLTCGVPAWTNHAAAATRVNVMPDRQVRPGVTLHVFGNAGNGGGVGDATALGEAYAWTFSSNVNVTVTPIGALAGVVASDRYIVADVSFALGGGSTREIITATLTVGGTPKSVKIDIVDPTDPISNTPLKKQQVDVNIAIEDGLRAMYLAQQPNGGWAHGNSGDASYICATTGFTVWAFSNSGHQPTNNINTDIYAEWVQKGVNFIVDGATPSAGPFPLLPDGSSPDADANNRIIDLCPGGVEGYATPIAANGIIAAYSGGTKPLTTVPAGHQFVGATYKQVIQDAIDWIAFAQNNCCLGPVGGGGAEGGWRYTANYGDSDTSVDSWNYSAMEGFEAAFGGTALEEVKREAERRLDASQCQAAPVGRFGYGGCGPAGVDGNATTAGGLSGLAIVTRSGRTAYHLDPAGGAADLVTGVFPDVGARKSAALTHLGNSWNLGPGVWTGNLGNFYAMWTTARALRLNGITTLVNDGTTFDWQTGEQPPGSGTVNPCGGPNEGYFHFLVECTPDSDGSWAPTVNTFYWSRSLNTAWAILVLQPTVFGPVKGQLTELSAAHLWVGLRNSNDQGTRFDLKVELLQNGTPVAQGLERCVNHVTRPPALAVEAIVNWDSFSPVPLSAGDVLTLRVSTRIGTTDDGTKCVPGPGGSHSNAIGLRLYYDSTSRPSSLDATITPNASQNLYLDSDGRICPGASSSQESQEVTTRFLDTTPPTAASPKCKDSTSINFSGGSNPFTVIGTWSMAPQP